MTRYFTAICGVALVLTSSALCGQSPAREPTDVSIRRSAGLPVCRQKVLEDRSNLSMSAIIRWTR